MRTPYAEGNGDFSNKAHEAAKEKIYPRLFGVNIDALEFESTLLETSDRNKILDGELGIDREVFVTVTGLHCPLKFTIQERFRRKQFAKYEDITITEWNNYSDLPSELYKITSGLFVYGYYDDEADDFIDAVTVPIPKLLLSLANGTVNYTKQNNPRSNQDFLCFTFTDLEAAGLIDYRYIDDLEKEG